jgi:cob(I)alamin adenosyltransferase
MMSINRFKSLGCFRLSNLKAFHTSSVLGTSSPDKTKKSHLYTRTGDKGSSSLYNGERRPKTDGVFETLGHQDELCAVLGIAREYCEASGNGLSDDLAEIQSRLFDLGAAVATPMQTSSSEKKSFTEFPSQFTIELENRIDSLDAALPPLTNFRIPSGGMSSTHLNLARAVCRRAERSVVPLVAAEQCDIECGKYLNRLSDYLFAAARTAAHKEGKEEKLWVKSKLLSK